MVLSLRRLRSAMSDDGGKPFSVPWEIPPWSSGEFLARQLLRAAFRVVRLWLFVAATITAAWLFRALLLPWTLGRLDALGAPWIYLGWVAVLAVFVFLLAKLGDYLFGSVVLVFLGAIHAALRVDTAVVERAVAFIRGASLNRRRELLVHLPVLGAALSAAALLWRSMPEAPWTFLRSAGEPAAVAGGIFELSAWVFGAIAVLYFLAAHGLAALDAWGSASPAQIQAESLPKSPPGASTEKLRIGHLSDLHLTKGEEVGLVEGGPSGNRFFRALCETQRHRLEQCDVVVINGDVTDTGDCEEWRAFFEAYPASLLEKTVLVPGNHDFNILTRAIGRAEDEDFLSRNVRLVRALAALDLVMGPRAIVFSKEGKTETLRKTLRGEASSLLRFSRRPSPGFRSGGDFFERFLPMGGPLMPERLWDSVFPLTLELPARRVVFFVLDSNKRSSHILSNGFGAVGPGLLKLMLLRKRYAGWRQIHLLHHHVALPPGQISKLELMARGLVLEDSSSFVRYLQSSPRALVFHGHRHVRYEGRIGESIQVVSASSSTLPDERSGAPPGFAIATVELAEDGAKLVALEWFPSEGGPSARAHSSAQSSLLTAGETPEV